MRDTTPWSRASKGGGAARLREARMKRTIAKLAVAAALLAGGAARAEKDGSRRTSPGEHGDGGKAALEWTEGQQDKLKKARRANREAIAKIRGERQAAMRALRDQIEDRAPESALSATLERLAKARRELRAQQDKFEAELASILTPTQRAWFETRRGRRVAMMGMMGEMGRGGPGRGGARHSAGEDGPDDDEEGD